MGSQRHTAEQIIGKLREAEVLQSKGMATEEILRQLGISDAAYYKRCREYGGLRVDQAKRLKELEHENSRLRTNVVFRDASCLSCDRTFNASGLKRATLVCLFFELAGGFEPSTC